jgi:hypothetical protein
MPSIWSTPATHVAGAADTCTCVRCKCGGSTPLGLRRVVEKVNLKYNDLDPQNRGGGK